LYTIFVAVSFLRHISAFEKCANALQKLVIMPLKGADDAGLFCIMIPLRQDRSIKALQEFRPYEHETGNDDRKPFKNNFIVLAARDQEKEQGVLHLVRNTLTPQELARNAVRSGVQRPKPGVGNKAGPKPTVEKSSQQGILPKIVKRKQQPIVISDLEPRSSAKKVRTKTLTGVRTSASGVHLSDDDMAEPLQLLHERCPTSRSRVQQLSPVSLINASLSMPAQLPAPQQIHASPNNVSKTSPIQTPTSPAVDVNRSQFTNEQAQHVHFVWKMEFEGMEYEARRNLSIASTFCSLLEEFRKETELVPSATRQMKASLWSVSYKLADGRGKAAFINMSSGPELNFNAVMRSLAEKNPWKTDTDIIVEIEIKALLLGDVQ
jgi:hypothetical protein